MYMQISAQNRDNIRKPSPDGIESWKKRVKIRVTLSLLIFKKLELLSPFSSSKKLSITVHMVQKNTKIGDTGTIFLTSSWMKSNSKLLTTKRHKLEGPCREIVNFFFHGLKNSFISSSVVNQEWFIPEPTTTF